MAATPGSQHDSLVRVNATIERAANRVQSLWQRVTEGLALQELWFRFKSEARESYSLYSREIDWTPVECESPWRRRWRIVRTLFWTMMEKLSPARRLFLLLGLVLVVVGFNVRVQVDGQRLEFVGGGEIPLLLGASCFLVLLALELADRVTMKRDLQIAREIQCRLVPDAPPAVPGFDIAFATRPANTVAGDYYDVFLRPNSQTSGPAGCLLLVVADVAGKGMPAALLMATIQASLHTLAGAHTYLAELVSGINRYASAHSLGGLRFTTAFIAELDIAARTLAYVNAGHNPPIICNGSGRCDRLEAGGLPLGIRSDALYETGTIVLNHGDLLAIFTDGLVDAENANGQDFGDARLVETLLRMPRRSAAEDLNRLLATVDAFVGTARQQDDITCLLLQVA